MMSGFKQLVGTKTCDPYIDDENNLVFTGFILGMKRRHITYYIITTIVVYLLLGTTPMFDYKNWLLPPSDELKVLCRSGKIEIEHQFIGTPSNIITLTGNALAYVRTTDLNRLVECGKFISTDQEIFPMHFIFHRRVFESIISYDPIPHVDYLNETVVHQSYEKVPMNMRHVAWYYGIHYNMHYNQGNMELLKNFQSQLDEHGLSGEPLNMGDAYIMTLYALLTLGKGVIVFFFLSCIFILHFAHQVIKSNN